jgi:hypothetical protein
MIKTLSHILKRINKKKGATFFTENFRERLLSKKISLGLIRPIQKNFSDEQKFEKITDRGVVIINYLYKRGKENSI